MPNLPALVTLLVAYAMVFAVGSPLEALSMELLPQPQRGRALAIRTIMMQVAALFYFQGLFPLFDRSFAIPAAVPFLGGGAVTGEQIIYFTNSAYFLAMVVFLVVGIRETINSDGIASWPGRWHFRPVVAIRAFFGDIFGDSRWWWVYCLSMFGPANLGNLCWARMDVLLTTEQFGYSKATVALMGLPTTFFLIVALTPFMGWYSDKIPRIPYRMLGLVFLMGGGLAVWLARTYLDFTTPQLPGLGWMFALSGLIGVSGTAFYIAVIQLGLNATRRHEGVRAWINYFSLAFQTAIAAASWILIKYGSDGATPSVLLWLMFSQFTGSAVAANLVVTGPMLFDFVPRDKMGTLSSGFGLVNGLISVVVGNLGGLWIFYCSKYFRPGAPIDYASNYLFQILVGLLGLAVLTLFLRSLRQGKVVEYGRLGLASTEAPRDRHGPVGS